MGSRKAKQKGSSAHRGVLEIIARCALQPQRELLARLEEGKAHTILSGGDQGDRQAWAQSVAERERREQRAAHTRSLERAKSLVQPAPLIADHRARAARPAVERAVRSGNDWRSYVWGHDIVWDLLRQAVSLKAAELGASPAESDNILAAIVLEVVETAAIAKLDAPGKELSDGPVDRLFIELLGAFGLANAPGVKLWYEALMAAMNPETAPAKLTGILARLSRKDSQALEQEELVHAGPLLRELVGAVRGIRAGPLLPPQDYKPTLEPIVRRWNTYARKTTTLPLLCKVCWVPVLLRQPAQIKTTRGRLRTARSEVCSKRCQRRDNRHSSS